MRGLLKGIIIVSGLLSLTACSTSQFAYSHFDSGFTVLASASTAQASDNKAYEKAADVCAKRGLSPKVSMVRRVPNSIKTIQADGKVIAIPTSFQRQDYMTAMSVRCVAKPS